MNFDNLSNSSLVQELDEKFIKINSEKYQKIREHIMKNITELSSQDNIKLGKQRMFKKSLDDLINKLVKTLAFFLIQHPKNQITSNMIIDFYQRLAL